jgi:hypothetical protein
MTFTFRLCKSIKRWTAARLNSYGVGMIMAMVKSLVLTGHFVGNVAEEQRHSS